MHELVQRANQVLSPVLGHYTSEVVERGEGCYLYTSDGRKILDFSSGLAVTSTGHCHPTVVKAIQDQASQLIHACIGVAYYDAPVRLAEALGARLGNGLTSVFFTQSGTEAVEAGLKLAKYVTKKPKLLAFKGGFHGRTLGSLALTTSKDQYRSGYDPLAPHVFYPYPDFYHSDETSMEAFEQKAIADMEAYFQTLDPEIGACIIEPMMGEGGYVPAPLSFLVALRRMCDVKGLLLIVDEIQTGFGRTGEWFCFQKAGIVPDIVLLAKGIASGMPLGACIARPELMAKWTTGSHGGTYGANPVTTAAGLATVEVLDDVIPGLNALSTKAFSMLNEGLGGVPFVSSIRGHGLMIGVEIVDDSNGNAPDGTTAKLIMERCLEKDLLVISCGPSGHVLRLIPPLVIDEETLTLGLERFIEVVRGFN